jgi:hypothetical protein
MIVYPSGSRLIAEISLFGLRCAVQQKLGYHLFVTVFLDAMKMTAPYFVPAALASRPNAAKPTGRFMFVIPNHMQVRRDTETERDRERQRETERDRERQRETERYREIRTKTGKRVQIASPPLLTVVFLLLARVGKRIRIPTSNCLCPH